MHRPYSRVSPHASHKTVPFLSRRKSGASDDTYLTIKEAARLLHLLTKWLYRHRATLPFLRKLGPRSYVCSKLELNRWLARTSADMCTCLQDAAMISLHAKTQGASPIETVHSAIKSEGNRRTQTEGAEGAYDRAIAGSRGGPVPSQKAAPGEGQK